MSAVAAAAGETPPVPLPPQASDPKVSAILSSFVAYRKSLFDEPDHDSAWQSAQLNYAFALGSPAADQNLLLNAPDFRGGHLDWYSFDLESVGTNQVSQANPRRSRPWTSIFRPTMSCFAACRTRAGGISRTRSPISASWMPITWILPSCW